MLKGANQSAPFNCNIAPKRQLAMKITQCFMFLLMRCDSAGGFLLNKIMERISMIRNHSIPPIPLPSYHAAILQNTGRTIILTHTVPSVSKSLLR